VNYSIAREGVFRSIQGEGALLGTPMVFIRLAGCSIGCPACDTDYRVTRKAGAADITAEAVAVRGNAAWAWVTGGEPTDRDLGPLADALRSAGFKLAIATAGVRPLPPGVWDWVSVSPHTPGKPAQGAGHELKLVFGLNGLEPIACDPRDYHSFPWRFANNPEWVDSHNGWRLNIQAHKSWGMP
jgi:organic radical activating enzyme